MSKEKVYISAIVYARNVETEIGPFLARLNQALSADFEIYDIVVIDDASTDGTPTALREAGASLPCNLTVVTLAWRHGMELAMLAGADAAIGDFILEIEQPYFDYPETVFIDMYRLATRSGSDIVSASASGSTRLSSWLFYKLLNHLSHSSLDLTTESLRLVTRRVINKVSCEKSRTRYRKALYGSSGYTRAHLDYTHVQGGAKTGDRRGERLSLGLDVLVMFTDLGSKLAAFFSTVFLIISAALGIYALAVFFLVERKIVEGWTTLMVFLSFGFSGIFLVLTLIGRYLFIILSEIQKPSLYSVRSIERIPRG